MNEINRIRENKKRSLRVEDLEMVTKKFSTKKNGIQQLGHLYKKEPYYKQPFDDDKKEIYKLENIQPNENNIKIIIKPSISVQIFNVILRYIYGEIVDLENCETRFIYYLMLAADEFELEELSNKLETLLIETKSSWLRTHFSFIYHFIFNRNDFKKLKNFCNDIVVKYPNLIFDADDFTSLDESALKLKFGIMSSRKFPTLQQCLPHIRYFHLSNIEVIDKIKPYKKIIGKQLWGDVKQHIIPERPIKSTILPPRSVLVTKLPPRTEEPFSTIISEEHAAKISTWIDRKTTAYTLTNIPYNFELILRGTRDVFAPQTFWDMCHGHASTIVLVKVKKTDEIIGGYNPLAWDSSNINDQWIETKDSFIFSLRNGNIENSILSRVKRPESAIGNRSKSHQKEGGPYLVIFTCIVSNLISL
ncbi:hypothetical protein Glove_177g140 [Diversispora epigaea]|uniref:TLDc domain-containing protein n=1 Tax=Diversispora epigaea TaxID=1348612 RepID=A0A397INE9_9GLOM|nr:hypothetical protein Glove_177g140 [Diversispora epigaea]